MPQLNLGKKNRNSNIYTNFPFHAKYFNDSFFPYFTKKYNELDDKFLKEGDLSSFKENLKTKLKPVKIRHFNFGSKKGNALHTQLRVGRTLLNSHSFQLNFSETNLCNCHRIETVSHFLLDCFIFSEERRTLFMTLDQIYPKFTSANNNDKLEILLNGINLQSEEMDCRNPRIFHAVQNFILKTKRF